MNADDFERWYLLFDILGLDATSDVIAHLLPGLAQADARAISRDVVRRYPIGPASVPAPERAGLVEAALAALDLILPGTAPMLRAFVHTDFAAMPSDHAAEREVLVVLWRSVYRQGKRMPPVPAVIKEPLQEIGHRFIHPELWGDLAVGVSEGSTWDLRRARHYVDRLSLPADLNPVLEPLVGTLEVMAARSTLRALRTRLAREEWAAFEVWLRSALIADGSNLAPQSLSFDRLWN